MAALKRKTHNLPSDAKLLFHVGDIMKAGNLPFNRDTYRTIANILGQSYSTVFIVHGDNDVNDCKEYDSACTLWKNPL